MRFISATALALLMATPVLADGHSGPKIYAYKSHANYCPAGMQPVTMDGTICCGVPNQAHTYQQVMAHGVAKKRHVKRIRAVRRDSCPVGTKGCSYD
ncbi:hypothetical protein [uncultured Tateyamaria sp.]|uniref:hypothetical protein n=1 Tax=Tateyamaria sp. 1078 TaxID=3417464 RepID=UPI002620A3AF|nr:hypothetical protein [uncultured Tateyamaria sp.]